MPAIEQVVIQFNWLKEGGRGDGGKRSMRTRKMVTGVTVGEFVRTARKMLRGSRIRWRSWAVASVKRKIILSGTGTLRMRLVVMRERTQRVRTRRIRETEMIARMTAMTMTSRCMRPKGVHEHRFQREREVLGTKA
jgi:hypothetical protein